ncbi:LPS export ABC transporter periplasmic protein LptC [Spirosoma taeanense]|uniref:LPS export ABC transporter periplasmic protein LptC n=1 Tax=Spirosoma taeanense TaxID=2735870 RepID=A0A6M5Y865_9BACT|nr:LPS export ABC transporter periplasmic protein LptC [Spirosoma taeanense]QJW90079.1 LPS export ABC transporter periplasmic protein LptC [Spirosoma taeanense]
MRMHSVPSINLILIAVLSGLLLACDEPKQVKKVAPYQGPVEEINDVRLLYSEAAMLKVKLTTARQFRYANDNRTYPKPVHISFYGPTGAEVTTLRSDSGRYDKAKDLYTVMGNVVVINKEKQEKLLTPELSWNPATKKVFTDKRVAVISQQTGEKLYGLGLDANQDFSQYSIRKPTGVFNVEGGL